MKRFLALILVALMVFSMVGCTTDSDNKTDDGKAQSGSNGTANEVKDPKPDEGETSEVQKGGTLKIAVTGDASSMLAYKLRGPTDRAFGCVLFEKLFNLDENGDPYPYLLDSYEEDTEALTYTLHVKKGIKFHDGSELNAEVVAWNLQLYKDQGVQSKSFLGNVDKIEAVDEDTVVLTLSAWDSLLPVYMAREGGCGYIMSQKAYEENGEDWCKEHFVSTAPFKFVSWSHDSTLVLEKFSEYWQGEPYLDGVEFQVFSNALVAQAAIENGEIHAQMNVETDVAEYLGNLGFNVTVGGIPANCYTVAFEGKKEGDPFSDIRVRQAASYAMDGAAIAAGMFGNYAEATTQYCRVGSTYYNDEVTGYPYDLEKAKALLTEAGYPDGFKTVLYVNSSTQTGIDFAQIVKEQLSQVGIDVELKLMDQASYNVVLDGWDGGMLVHPMGVDSGAPAQIAGSYARDLSSGIGLNSFNRTEELYQAIEQGKASDKAGCIENFKKAQYIIFEEQCMLKALFLTFPLSVTSPKLHDAEIGGTASTSADLWDAWLEK